MGTCACAFRPFFFFIVCPQDPHGTTTHSLPNPKKKNCFQKNSSFGQCHHRILISPKRSVGRSVSNSYFYSSRVFYTKYVYGSCTSYTYVYYFMPYNLPNKKILPSGSSTTIFFFSFPIFTHLGILSTFVYFFPYTFHKKYGVEGKAQGGERGLYRNNKGPHKTEPRARVRIM